MVCRGSPIKGPYKGPSKFLRNPYTLLGASWVVLSRVTSTAAVL